MINKVDIFREGVIIASVDIDEGTMYNEKLNGTKLITCPIVVQTAIDLQEGDYIVYEDEPGIPEIYIINTLPKFSKDSSSLSKNYDVVFETEFYLLLNDYIFHEGDPVFPYYSNARGHLQLMVDNANRNSSGWLVGEVDDTEEKHIDYNWTYARTALDEIAARFGLEYKVSGRTIRMVKTIGRDTGLTFEVGIGKGLHQIERAPDTGKNVINRAYGLGGTRNIDASYRDGTTKGYLVFEERYVETPGVTAGTERVKEGKFEDPEIYPRFKGSVTGTTLIKDAAGEVIGATITDTAIDFDINAQLALMPKEMKPKASFLTGALTGVDFEIEKYDHATKTITLIINKDTNGYPLPNALNFPEPGDKFTLIDMMMPAAYKVASELELKEKTLEFLNDNKLQRLLYGLTPDEKVLRSNNIRLSVGDRSTVVDTDINANEMLRVTEIGYPIVNRFKVSAIIGNEIRYDKVVKLFADVVRAKKEIQVIDRKSAELAKRGVQNLRAFEQSIFDTDGMLQAERYNVGVLTAILGIFGAKSQNFKLNQVFITDNFNGNANSVFISTGELIHFEISNPGDKNIWVMSDLVQIEMEPASLYYVYAKCSRLAQFGSWVVTTEQIKPEDVPDYYHFLAGVVYPVLNGWRNSDFTNGIADINGNRLKIGKIVSRDGQTGFDLDNSTIFGKISFRTNNGGLKDIALVEQTANDAAKAIAGVEDYITAVLPTEIADLQAQIDGAIESYFYQYDPTPSNLPASEWNTPELKLKHGNDTFSNTSTGASWRWVFENGEWTWKVITDTATQQALLLAGKAKDTADGKRTVFVDQPYTPYLRGDLWAQGAGGELMRCVTERLAGAFNASDWGKSSKYTDDTAVNNLQVGGRNYYWAGLNFNGYQGAALHWKSNTGMLIAGTSANTALMRLSRCITSNGWHTVSFDGWVDTVNWNATTQIVCNDAYSSGALDFTTSSKRFTFTFNVQNWTDAVYNFIDFQGLSGQGYRIENLMIEKGNKASDFSIAPEAVATDAQSKADAAQTAAIASANATAEAIAQAKANTAKLEAIAAASSDAQAKAEQARVNAINASNAYAATVANDKASQAQINAAADASNKAEAARVAAVNAANAQYATLTNSLKATAYQDIDQWAINGQSVFQGGKLNVLLLDAAYIRANIINAAYIEALDIVSKSIRTDSANRKRIIIDGVENNIRLLDENNNVVSVLDDDSAQEAAYYTLYPPLALTNPITGEVSYPKDYLYMAYAGSEARYYYSSMGPGLSIGISPTHAAGFSYIGRKAITTTGSINAGTPNGSQRSSMDRNGIRTTGTITVRSGSTDMNGISGRFAYFYGQDAYHLIFSNGILVGSGNGA
ncbi:phage tail protein [Pedobacter gandavensis]|uniref:Tail spike domain-containing protein n=1 Tax=Pedobacter gandavensis TaxID=2679963 RepID=A0ABR6EUA3_9SPHI|nr:phage tail protein [Pedobacter gandavensis]MBB2148781.1 hypothetical protein [Pedobacter gandavensis]